MGSRGTSEEAKCFPSSGEDLEADLERERLSGPGSRGPPTVDSGPAERRPFDWRGRILASPKPAKVLSRAAAASAKMPPARWELTDGELKCVCCRVWEPEAAGNVGLATGSRTEFEFAFAIVLPARAETVEEEEWEEVVFEAVPEVAGALPVFALLLMLELLPLALLDLLLVTVLPVLRLPACNATTGEESELAVDVERDDDEPAAI